jgi:hypothetical protein
MFIIMSKKLVNRFSLILISSGLILLRILLSFVIRMIFLLELLMLFSLLLFYLLSFLCLNQCIRMDYYKFSNLIISNNSFNFRKLSLGLLLKKNIEEKLILLSLIFKSMMICFICFLKIIKLLLILFLKIEIKKLQENIKLIQNKQIKNQSI